MRQLLVLLTLLCVSALYSYTLIPSTASAKSDFSVSVTATYTFAPSGQLTVVQAISSTNLTSKSMLTGFGLDITGSKPTNIKAHDTKDLQVAVSKSSTTSTRLAISGFSSPAAGLGKTHNFTLSYTGDSELHQGLVKKIALPGLSNLDFYDRYQLAIVAPKAWGFPTITSFHSSSYLPNFTSTTQKMLFTKKQLDFSPVSIVFGNLRTYSFSLKYTLPGSGNLPRSIILLPDTHYQKVHLDSLTPKPEQVIRDNQGNWLAFYSAAAPRDVLAKGTINVFTDPLVPLDKPSFPASTSRDVLGYLISDSKIHRWSQTWDPRDQKWLSPYADYNHLVLYILPQPNSAAPSTITFLPTAYQDPDTRLPLSAISIPGQLFPTLLNRLDWIITNPSGVAKYDLPVSFASIGMTLSSPFPSTIPVLPPFSTLRYSPTTTSFPLLHFSPRSFTLTLGSQPATYNIPAASYFMWHLSIAYVAAASLTILGYIAHSAWYIHFQKRGSRHSLHR